MEVATLDRAAAPDVTSLSPSHFGVVVGGTPNGDVIVLSAQALAILKAGRLVRALVIAGLEALRRTVAIGAGCALSLEYGFYRITSLGN